MVNVVDSRMVVTLSYLVLFVNPSSQPIRICRALPHSSPEGAEYVSPGRKPWVTEECKLSPGGTAENSQRITLAQSSGFPPFAKDAKDGAPGIVHS